MLENENDTLFKNYTATVVSQGNQLYRSFGTGIHKEEGSIPFIDR
jgi:hypothetical protein